MGEVLTMLGYGVGEMFADAQVGVDWIDLLGNYMMLIGDPVVVVVGSLEGDVGLVMEDDQIGVCDDLVVGSDGLPFVVHYLRISSHEHKMFFPLFLTYRYFCLMILFSDSSKNN
jgi:hypothetical protein